eukprot:Opistho-2@15066
MPMPARSLSFVRQRQWGPWVALLLIMGLAWSGAARWLQLERQGLHERESEKLVAQVQALDALVSQQLITIHAALKTLAVRQAAGLPPAQAGPQLLQALAEAMPGVRALSLIDAQGHVRASSAPELQGLDGSRQPYFTAPRPCTLR